MSAVRNAASGFFGTRRQNATASTGSSGCAQRIPSTKRGTWRHPRIVVVRNAVVKPWRGGCRPWGDCDTRDLAVD
jgi:hypothetical protein